jgi:DNA (cytosine-5)-methyltransferase 1
VNYYNENDPFAAQWLRNLSAAGVGAPHIRQRLFWVGHTEHAGLERHHRHGAGETRWAQPHRSAAPAGRSAAPWAEAQWLNFADGKKRPVQSGVSPLADVDPGRMGRLRAYGNAIVTEVAETFITAVMDTI